MTTRSVPSGRPLEAISSWLKREGAACHLVMSPTFFDTLVREDVLPQPGRIGTRTLYDRQELDAAMARVTRSDDDEDEFPEPE